ncbi:hypothetical protein GCM10009725_06320 [Aeromicrobium tamlense]
MSVCSDFRFERHRSVPQWSGSALGLVPHPVGQGFGVRGSFESKGPDERPPVEGELQAPFRGVQMRSAARSSAVWVGLHGDSRGTPSGDDSHQSGLLRTLPAADARTNHHRQV